MAWIKNWFSNMLPCDKPFYYDNVEYWTVENFYQAMKSQTRAEAAKIACMSPFAAKNYWRNHTPRQDFDKIKLEVMEYALRQKFCSGSTWLFKLMETGDEEIVENNNWGDKFWGVDVRNGLGLNHLGNILMKIREEYRDAKRTRRPKKEKK